jgi:hypothetical protein
MVSWDNDGRESEDENSGPFSVTKVVADTATDGSIRKADEVAADAKNSANMALYAGIAGVVVGLAGVYLGTRKD